MGHCQPGIGTKDPPHCVKDAPSRKRMCGNGALTKSLAQRKTFQLEFAAGSPAIAGSAMLDGRFPWHHGTKIRLLASQLMRPRLPAGGDRLE
jgi:hypothetical protein